MQRWVRTGSAKAITNAKTKTIHHLQPSGEFHGGATDKIGGANEKNGGATEQSGSSS